MKLMVTMGASTLTWPIKMNAMEIKLVRQMPATGVLLGPRCNAYKDKRKVNIWLLQNLVSCYCL